MRQLVWTNFCGRFDTTSYNLARVSATREESRGAVALNGLALAAPLNGMLFPGTK